ncbi:MAG: HD domain-containing protein [Parvibaculaceae bacterium]|nr:HD domain-containing protein [Parvibaculaceae bacterium]
MTLTIQLPSAPDSLIAQAATLFLAEVSAPEMVHHCHRSFLFADLLGEKTGRRADKEALYISALFHDLGLDHATEGEESFEVRGGNAAEAFLLSRGADTRLASSVNTAISLHTDLASADHDQPEVALLHMGAMVDVVGMRIDDIPAKTLERILEEHPRSGCKSHLKNLLNAEALRHPASNIATALRDLDLGSLIDQAPFVD